MEDAHLALSPLSDKKNSLFAVFDGHGGNITFRFRSLSFKVCGEALPDIAIGKS
jgi:serine/threonine protein phosphatase PrpC